MIHDDYRTHAANIDTLHACIRESFVKLYTDHDPLQELYNAYPDLLPPPPSKGTLDIREVLKSQFFFG
jgi:DNA-directed RNA polymerase